MRYYMLLYIDIAFFSLKALARKEFNWSLHGNHYHLLLLEIPFDVIWFLVLNYYSFGAYFYF